MAKKAMNERAFDNIQKAREKVQAAVILDPAGRKVGSVVHRWTYPTMGAVCHTSFKLGCADDYNIDPVIYYTEAGGGGYDKAAHNMAWVFLDRQPQIEALTGRPYPKDPEGGLSCYLANHWDRYLEDAGYRVIEAL
jgi:hypothetical protein